MKKYIVLIIIVLSVCLLFSRKGVGQDTNFMDHYNSGNYKDALTTINKQLEEIYYERIDTIKPSTEFIMIKDEKNEIDLRLLFRKRKVSGFFIEDKKEISDLHLYAGKCYFKQSKYNDSLNHYIQSLRFKNLEYNKDDATFYEIAQVFKKMGHFNAFINALEVAYRLNPNNASYSLEIGLALYSTADKKRSIFHLERYINNTEETIDPSLYLKLGNLFEDISQYLQTEKYYIQYLKQKTDDGYIQLALGYLTYKRTGHYDLSLTSLKHALQLLPEKDLFERSMAYELKGNIEYHRLEFNNAITSYSATIKYQESIQHKIDSLKKEIHALQNEINKMKKNILNKQMFEQYEEYDAMMQKKGKKELLLQTTENQFKRLNAGKIRWDIADCYERSEDLNKAIEYYREAITFNYKANHAREKIIKLKLKIKRGY